MKCDKCKLDFEEREIQVSHDIPKYLGGTDKDGRHNLCINCHKKYEDELLKIVLMNYFKNFPEGEKEILKKYAKIVSKFYFKEGDLNE